jgi:hypothetical protein
MSAGLGILLGFTMFSLGCGSDNVDSNEEARRAYLGLDLAIDKGIDLGFKGFNAANSANIPAQMTTGSKSGTMTVTGQVDQGSSNNKGMRLSLAMATYSDIDKYTYDTDPAKPLPALDMMLKSIPTGTLDGTFAGELQMAGTLKGPITLTLSFTATLEPDPAGAVVHRKPGTTHITGTAVSPAGRYSIDVSR